MDPSLARIGKWQTGPRSRLDRYKGKKSNSDGKPLVPAETDSRLTRTKRDGGIDERKREKKGTRRMDTETNVFCWGPARNSKKKKKKRSASEGTIRR